MSDLDLHCGNCKVKVSTDNQLQAEFTSYDDGFEIQVTVQKAFFTVFEHGIQQVQENEGVSVKLCNQCTMILAELYRFYLEFMKLTKEFSTAQQLIKTSVLWEHLQLEDKHLLRKPRSTRSSRSKYVENVNVKDEPPEEQDMEITIPDLGLSELHYLDNLDFLTEEQDEKVPSSLVTAVIEETQLPEAINGSRRARAKTKKGALDKKSTGPFECTDCKKVYLTATRLYDHRRYVHVKRGRRRSFTCTQPGCTASFFFRSKLNWHLVLAHGIGERLKDRECTTCGKYFSIPSKLTLHLQTTHLPESSKIHECPHCPARFPLKIRLEYHIRDRHNVDGESRGGVTCEYCGKLYATVGGYRMHVKQMHESPTTFACPICQKTSHRPEWLSKHLPMHDNNRERTFSCDQCDKTFYRQKSLKRHQKNHSQDKAYVCSHCGDKFAQGTGLRRHVLAKHSEEVGPFVCEICGKGFKIREYLTQHMRSKTHGGKGHGLYTPAGKRRLQREQQQAKEDVECQSIDHSASAPDLAVETDTEVQTPASEATTPLTLSTIQLQGQAAPLEIPLLQAIIVPNPNLTQIVTNQMITFI